MRLKNQSWVVSLVWAALTSPVTTTPVPQVAPGATLQEDTGQVAINSSPDEANDTAVPITATIFHGVPGPKACRGPAMNVLNLPQPAAQHSAELCYDFPTTAGCGLFVANKADGCEAKLFGETGCQSYLNTAVFMPEQRAVGGNWRSMSVRCGIEPPDPESLGAPPLAGMIKNHTPKGQ